MALRWLTHARYVGEHRIEIRFNTGESGVVDLSDQLGRPPFNGLHDPIEFERFKLNSWTVEWPNGADLAPEFLYERMTGPFS